MDQKWKNVKLASLRLRLKDLCQFRHFQVTNASVDPCFFCKYSAVLANSFSQTFSKADHLLTKAE